MQSRIPLRSSFRFRFVIMVVAVQLIFVVIAMVYLLRKQTEIEVQKTFETNEVSVKIAASFIRNAMNVFGENLTLLAVTPAVSSFDPIQTGQLLKSYRVASLFISGERVAIYDNKNRLIADNDMVTVPTDSSGYEYFWNVDPTHVYMGPTEWQDYSPQRSFAVTAQNPARANGVLTAEFSFRRLYSFLKEHRIGKNGYLVVVDFDGNLLYHPDPHWTKEPVPFGNLGFPLIDLRLYTVDHPTYIEMKDGREYMINYLKDPSMHMGVFSLLPRSELQDIIRESRNSMLIMWFLLVLVMTLISIWISSLLAKPLQTLTEKMILVRDGNLDVDSGIHRKDEIGQLAEVFDTMRISIRQYIHELGAHRDRLEAEVAERTKELERTNHVLQLMSRTDDLTGIPNRRDIMEKIRYEMYRSQRNQKPFSFIIGDIDKFKSFNDTYGHDCGDGVLRSVALSMQSVLRRQDYIARWGGEEFLVVLPETDQKGAHIVAERIRTSIAETDHQFAGKNLRVTITLGLALFDPRLGIDRSIALADRALYKGKKEGRNRVWFWDPKDVKPEEYEAAAKEMAAQESELELSEDVVKRLDQERRRLQGDLEEGSESANDNGESVSS